LILRQYLHESPVISASYLLGCGGQAKGIVVDPIEEAAFYQHEAKRLGLTILYVIDTHVHADHLSSGRDLAALSGAAYALHSSVQASYSFYKIEDGDTLELGNVKVTFWHTPGHTPEHLTLLVTDHTRSAEPWLVLTSHTLMVGDMGRTELALSAEDGAKELFTTAQRLKTLPSFVEIYPGAFSGSVCGRGLSGKAISTIGFEKHYNKAFQVENEQHFISLMLQDIPPRPPHFESIRTTNLGFPKI
jgi:glyoxylase-like metal-dependent hydrolase (beta-lactamase superfamily II)